VLYFIAVSALSRSSRLSKTEKTRAKQELYRTVAQKILSRKEKR
jgi:hypothetical protein